MARKTRHIGRKFEAVHRSRELAVQFLYSLDIHPEQNFDEALELFLNLDEVSQNDSPEVKERCRNLVSGVWSRKSEIDGLLMMVLVGWRPERLVSVDRAILRLMVYEGFLEKTLPIKSAISEAGGLAYSFGTLESKRFVNGVMFRISQQFEQEGESEQ